MPMVLGVVPGYLEEALADHTWLAAAHWRRRHREDPVLLDVFVDATSGDSAAILETAQDVPLNFDPKQRSHGWRQVKRFTVPVANPDDRSGGQRTGGGHDPFELVP